MFILLQLKGFDNIIHKKKKWAKSKMDSHFNSTEKLLPLLHPGKRVTTHQLEKSLRKMGFRSWKSFLPGILQWKAPFNSLIFEEIACKNIYFLHEQFYIQIKTKTAKFYLLQTLKCNVKNISCFMKKRKRKKCTFSSIFSNLNQKKLVFSWYPFYQFYF